MARRFDWAEWVLLIIAALSVLGLCATCAGWTS